MNTAVMKRESLGETKPEKTLEARIAELTEDLAKTDKSLSASRLSQATLASERQGLVLLARVKKDPKAQARLLAIDEDLVRIVRDIADYTSAVSELEEELEAAKNALTLAQWESRRAELRQSLLARLDGKGGARLDKAAAAFGAALRAAVEEEDAMVAELGAFAPKRYWGELRKIRVGRAQLLAVRLRDVLPIDNREVPLRVADEWTAQSQEERYLRDALEALDRLELVF